jgi:hypothetical protein
MFGLVSTVWSGPFTLVVGRSRPRVYGIWCVAEASGGGAGWRTWLRYQTVLGTLLSGKGAFSQSAGRRLGGVSPSRLAVQTLLSAA